MFLTDTIVFNCFPFTAKVEPYSSDTCTTEAPETQTGLIIGVVCGVSIFNLVVGAIFIACCYRRAQKMERLPTYNSENCQFLNTWFNIHDFDLLLYIENLPWGWKVAKTVVPGVSPIAFTIYMHILASQPGVIFEIITKVHVRVFQVLWFTLYGINFA